MRRQNEVIPSSQQHSTTVTATAPASVTVTATGPGPSTATPSPPVPAALPHTTPAALSLVPPTTPQPSASSVQDSLNTPTTPLGRTPLQFTAPPAPASIVAPAPAPATPFSYYNNNATVAAGQPGPSYLHHSQTVASKSAGNEPGVELDEYVDILQVQQLLLDSSAAAAASAANPSQQEQHQQQQQQDQSLQPLAKPRPRINLQKASEYAAQLAQGKSGRLSLPVQVMLTLAFPSRRDTLACLASRTARLS